MDDYYKENEILEEVIQWELDAINNYIVSVESRSKKLSKNEKATKGGSNYKKTCMECQLKPFVN